MPHPAPRRSPLPLVLLAGGALSGCSGGSGGGSAGSFEVLSIGVFQGQEWRINRPIDISFSQDVDFSTVSHNTIVIADQAGNGGTGVFTQPRGPDGVPDPRKVRFQPTCPTQEDLSDAGLQPSSDYSLRVMGSVTGGLVVHSTSGQPLEQGALVNFATPDSSDPQKLFQDTVPGPPLVRLRGAGGVALDDPDATALQVGGVAVYFELDSASAQGRLPLGFEVPLNHYSIPENRVAAVVHLNQAIESNEVNISDDRVRFEYFDGVDWLMVQTDVRLIANCTETGAVLELVPQGILPQDSPLRINLRAGFSDITGDTTSSDTVNFARMDVVAAGGPNPLFPGITNPEADDFLEGFVLSGDDLGSIEDTLTAFGVPRAEWGEGALQATFGFNGTGGPDGDFDWHIPPGTEVVLDTTFDIIVGGPGGTPTTTQVVVDGVVDIRDLFIPASSRLIIVGPNTCQILASGDVRMLGRVLISGSDVEGVQGLNTTNLPEPGANGQGGGGDGGTGSFLTTQSTPRGGPGFGAFDALAQGGEGGETGYAPLVAQHRRAGGGGGGLLGQDTYYDHDGDPGTKLLRCQILVGLDGEDGAHGGALGLGAESQSQRPQGGHKSPSPFQDASDENDFFGTMLRADGELVVGELDHAWAGAGGGAGGDAVDSDSFPLIPWDVAGDEKGAGGGGGAGGLEFLAIGQIQIGDESAVGVISADGGDGNGGESQFDRVGGGSGGGAGGHIIFSSATRIVIYGRAASAAPWFGDDPTDPDHSPRPISAVGGQGGEGNTKKGGANEEGPITWKCDRVPYSHAEGFESTLPPFNQSCYDDLFIPDEDDPEGGPVVGAGGDGGPGLIQFHVEEPSRLIFPTLEAELGKTWEEGLDMSYLCAPPPLGWHAPDDPSGLDQMVPFFGKRSVAQSKWIPLGLARVNPGGSTDQVLLRALAGPVPHDGSVVDQDPPILGPEPLNELVPPFIGPDERTLVFDASGLAPTDQLYKDNPALVKAFSVQLSDTADVNNFQRFTVSAASYDADSDRLTCQVDPSGPSLVSFVPGGDALVALIPHHVRVVTSGVFDSYPVDTEVTVRFDATKIDPLVGGPSDQSLGFTEDLSALNAQDWDYVRFQVEFDLDLDGNGIDLTTPRPALDHLRISFEF